MKNLNIDHLLTTYKKELIKRSFTERSIQTYLDDTRSFLKYLKKNDIEDLKQITKRTISDYQHYLFYKKTNQNRSIHASTQSKKLIIVKSFLQTMADLNIILFNPASDIELPRQEKKLPRNILKFQEIKRIEKGINTKNILAFRDKVIMEILFTTGVRVTELINIKLSDIDLENKTLNILKGKGGKARIIPLLTFIIRLIEKYISQVRPKLSNNYQTDYFLLNASGDRIKYKDYINSIIKKYCKKARIKKNITTHSFRSSFATVLLNNGASIRHIQRLLGHKKLKTTQIYTQVSIEDLKRVHSKCHPFEKKIYSEVNKNERHNINNIRKETVLRTYKRS